MSSPRLCYTAPLLTKHPSHCQCASPVLSRPVSLFMSLATPPACISLLKLTIDVQRET